MRFDRQISTALRLIKKNGQKVVWRKIEDVKNTDKPWLPSDAIVTNYDVDICFLPVGREGMDTMVFFQNTEVEIGSVKGLMGDVDFEPSLKDVVIRGEEELRILSIDLLSPNGQEVLYKIRFK